MKRLILLAVAALVAFPAAAQMQEAYPSYIQTNGRAELEITPDKLNGLDLVQGGAIFTLADLAFAGAANSGGIPTVSASVNLSYIRPGTGTKLRAVASEVSRGRRTGVYSVQVFDGAGKIVAHGSITGFAFEPRPTA